MIPIKDIHQLVFVFDLYAAATQQSYLLMCLCCHSPQVFAKSTETSSYSALPLRYCGNRYCGNIAANKGNDVATNSRNENEAKPNKNSTRTRTRTRVCVCGQ